MGADLGGMDLSHARLAMADLTEANLSGADLSYADLKWSNMRGANLSEAILQGATLSWARLSGTDFSRAIAKFTVFADIDLSETIGLNTVKHYGPSIIGIDTLYKSGGTIPESFLRSCGVPDEFIVAMPTTIKAQQANPFDSCFISCSTKDEEFIERLYSRLQAQRVPVWFAPKDIRGVKKLHEQIEIAIQMYDRLLIVLSEDSLQSEWVMTEIREAWKRERAENRRKLFPIRLVDLDTLRAWKCFDADVGKDLAVEIREYFIPDFSNWKDHDAFEAEFAGLLNGLRAAEGK